MNEFLSRLRRTRAGNSLGVVRVFLGLLFLSTGLLKIFMPPLRAAFSGQLTQAGVPALMLLAKIFRCHGFSS